MAKQRETFDQVADLYAQTRPQVPDAAVEALWTALDLGPGSRVLEIGCGTGQLTRHLLGRGADVTCVEPGAALAQVCEQELGGPRLTVEVDTFEAWQPGTRRFEAVTACQAAHWIEPTVFLDRSADALVPGGRVGFVWHFDLSQDTPFWKATQPIYDHHLPNVDEIPPRTLPVHAAAYEAAIEDDPRFTAPTRVSFPWQRDFDGETYIALLRTNSPVRMLADADREDFLARHAQVIDEFDGRVTRLYETTVISTRVRA